MFHVKRGLQILRNLTEVNYILTFKNIHIIVQVIIIESRLMLYICLSVLSRSSLFRDVTLMSLKPSVNCV